MRMLIGFVVLAACTVWLLLRPQTWATLTTTSMQVSLGARVIHKVMREHQFERQMRRILEARRRREANVRRSRTPLPPGGEVVDAARDLLRRRKD